MAQIQEAKLQSPASWEAQYDEMRQDERMALRTAVEGEEYEQAMEAEAEWEAQNAARMGAAAAEWR